MRGRGGGLGGYKGVMASRTPPPPYGVRQGSDLLEKKWIEMTSHQALSTWRFCCQQRGYRLSRKGRATALRGIKAPATGMGFVRLSEANLARRATLLPISRARCHRTVVADFWRKKKWRLGNAPRPPKGANGPRASRCAKRDKF